jgi:hypothetical protein
MEIVGFALAIGYVIGMFVAASYYRKRCGLTELKVRYGIDWREFFLRNLHFFLWMYVKILFWAVVLVVWLVAGQPACPWRAVINVHGVPARKIAWVGFRPAARQ